MTSQTKKLGKQVLLWLLKDLCPGRCFYSLPTWNLIGSPGIVRILPEDSCDRLYFYRYGQYGADIAAFVIAKQINVAFFPL